MHDCPDVGELAPLFVCLPKWVAKVGSAARKVVMGRFFRLDWVHDMD
jgi:hypothetical protein